MFRKLSLTLSLLALVVIPAPFAAAQDENVINIVTVTGGQVQGVPTDVESVQVFKGIPFAGPSGGEFRWASPQPVIPWEGVLIADTWGDQAMQPIDLNPPGTFWGDEFYYDPDYMPV
jgi:para-nitrobenzyl esterase